jgi:hypothetical protein
MASASAIGTTWSRGYVFSALIFVRNAPSQATNALDLEELASKGMIQWEEPGITRRRPCLTALGEKFYTNVVERMRVAA